jgi:type IV secretion system protein VirB6
MESGASALGNMLSRVFGSWSSQSAAWDSDLEQFLFYRVIILHLRREIDKFGSNLLENFTTIVGMVALLVLTLWILIQGYRIVTGQSCQSMMALVINAAKATFIVTVALALGSTGSYWNNLLGTDMPAAITRLVTDEPDATAEEQIDESLAWMQVAFKAIDAVNVSGDAVADDAKDRALLMTAVGSGGPAVVAGAMLMLYQVAIALFMGLGPLFILCLLFDFTKSLFHKWLLYGIGTMFSMAMLAAMVSICMEMVVALAKATWEVSAAGQLLGTNFESGLTSNAMQQGGLGLLMTTLILGTPPMAAMFFQGTLGSFMAYSQMGAASMAGAARPGLAEQPPGSFGGSGYASPQSVRVTTEPGLTNLNTPRYTGSNSVATTESVGVGSRGVANNTPMTAGAVVAAPRSSLSPSSPSLPARSLLGVSTPPPKADDTLASAPGIGTRGAVNNPSKPSGM